MKMMLSMPSTSSSRDSVKNAIQICGSNIHSIVQNQFRQPVKFVQSCLGRPLRVYGRLKAIFPLTIVVTARPRKLRPSNGVFFDFESDSETWNVHSFSGSS